MRRRGRDPFLVGLVALLAISAITYLGFAKRLPWDRDYEIRAVFRSANELHRNSPVRIAGVNVGKVRRVERGPGTTSIVTMAIDEGGRPIRTDATLKIRPRIFLEGNFFVDVRPGTGGAPELRDGGTVPLGQTAVPVQLDEVLSTLNASTRSQLQTLVDELARALRRGGAGALRRGFADWEDAFAGSAVVAEALRGTERHDLSRFVAAQARVSAALAAHDRELAGMVTAFARTVGALADRQEAVAASLRGLAGTLRAAPPALAATRRALPAVRALAVDLRPGLRGAAVPLRRTVGLLAQVRGLLGPRELPSLVARLRPLVPDLVRLQPPLGSLLELVTPVTDCVRRQALPVLEAKLDDDALSTGQPVWLELVHGMVGLASGSQNFDGNGPSVRYHGGYGDQLFSTGQVPQVGQLFGLTSEPVLGSRPPWPGPDKEPPFRPDVPCVTQAPVDLRAGTTPPPVSQPGRLASLNRSGLQRMLDRMGEAGR